MRAHPSQTGRVSRTRERLRRATAARTSQLDSQANPPVLTHDQIASRAYEIYLRRGASHGDEIQDWLAAEQELLGQLTAAAIRASADSEAEEPDRTGLGGEAS